MKLPRRNFLHLVAGAAALPAVSRIAAAQAYPTRPATMVVTFPPAADPTFWRESLALASPSFWVSR
jgi:hypothetical protein